VVNAQEARSPIPKTRRQRRVDALLTVTDVDSADLAGATVSITGNFQSGQDVLGFVNRTGSAVAMSQQQAF
jgi:hypothetical protein